MLKKYRPLIYKTKDDEKRTIEQCINRVQKYHPDCTKAEIYDSIKKNKLNILDYDFTRELLMLEGWLLFEIVNARFGQNLWSSNLLPNDNCEKMCPVGEICDKACVEINTKCFCYGQLLQKKIDINFLRDISSKEQVRILKSNGKILIDLSNSNYDEELLAEYFFKFDRFISRFGDYGERGFKKVNGNNVIVHL